MNGISKVQEYLDHAAECESLANEAGTTPHTRELMLYLAARWRAFADEAAGKESPEPRPVWKLPATR
jgi:hypothetical protein